MKIKVKKRISPHVVYVRVTKTEFAKLQRIALKTNRSMCEVIRMCIAELQA